MLDERYQGPLSSQTRQRRMDVGGSLTLIQRQEGPLVQVLVAGIDVAKDTLCVCVYAKGRDQPLDKPLEFANVWKGWSKLITYLQGQRERYSCELVEVYL